MSLLCWIYDTFLLSCCGKLKVAVDYTDNERGVDDGLWILCVTILRIATPNYTKGLN